MKPDLKRLSLDALRRGISNSDAIERALGHIESNDVRCAYLRGEHWEERVKMALWWADELDEMRNLDGDQ